MADRSYSSGKSFYSYAFRDVSGKRFFMLSGNRFDDTVVQ
jgi:hypothetical protein